MLQKAPKSGGSRVSAVPTVRFRHAHRILGPTMIQPAEGSLNLRAVQNLPLLQSFDADGLDQVVRFARRGGLEAAAQAGRNPDNV